MDATKIQILKNVMFELIKEEDLPRPKNIMIRQPSQGRRRLASGKAYRKISRIGLQDEFSIIITVTKPTFVLNPQGRFIDKNNQRYMFTGWKEEKREDIIHTVAHEIAHLRFWAHSPKHISYTNHLNEILLKKLEGWNTEV